MRIVRPGVLCVLTLTGLACGAPELTMRVSRTELRGSEQVATIKLSALTADLQPGRGTVEFEVIGAEGDEPSLELDADGLGQFEVRSLTVPARVNVRATWAGVTSSLEATLRASTRSQSVPTSSSSSPAAPAPASQPVQRPVVVVGVVSNSPVAPTAPPPMTITPTASCPSSTGRFGGLSVEAVVSDGDGKPTQSEVVFTKGLVKVCAVSGANGWVGFHDLMPGAWVATVNTSKWKYHFAPSGLARYRENASVPHEVIVAAGSTNSYALQSGF